MKYYAMLLAAYGFFAASCERHEFDGPNGTRQLHDKHGTHETHQHAGDDQTETGEATAE